MLHNLYGLSGDMYFAPDAFGPPQGYRVMGHLWDLSGPNKPINSFVTAALIDEDSNALMGLHFSFMAYDPEFDPGIRPQRIIREVGMPSLWTMNTQLGGQGSSVELASLMVYRSGMIFFQTYSLPAEQVQSGPVSKWTAQFCLGEWNSHHTIIGIGEPFDSGYADLSSAQSWAYLSALNNPSFRPIQEMLNVDLSEITRRATVEDNPCFPIFVPQQ